VSDRLLPAVERGLVEPLTQYGFVASGGGGHRGETVECTNGTTLITISADWLEGEMALRVQRSGQPSTAIEDLLDLTQVHGLHLLRLPRNVSVGTLEAQLRKIANALIEQVPELLVTDALPLSKVSQAIFARTDRPLD
jgi:hypothetical protein